MSENSIKSLGVVVPQAGRIVLQSFDVPPPGPGMVLIEAAFSTLSPGTEYGIMTGALRPFPVDIGYSLAGRVRAIGAGVEGLQIGDAVVTTGRHASFVLADHRFVTPVPPGVDLESAAFFNLAHTALYGVRRAEIKLGEPVVVLGQGLVGLLAAKLAQLAGALPVVAVDIDEARLALSRRIGLPVVVDAGDEAGMKAALAELDGGPAVVLEATGRRPALETALDVVRERGRIVLLSTPTGDERIDFQQRLSWKGASLIGAYVNSKPWSLQQTEVEMPGWPPTLSPGARRFSGSELWSSDADVRVVLNLMRYGGLDLQPLITHRFAPQDAPAAYDMVLRQDRALVGGVIDWTAGP